MPCLSLRLLVAAVISSCGATAVRAAEDIVIADFEGPDYGGWTVEGEAFGIGSTPGTLPGQMDVSGFHGQGYVNSYHGGDATTGRMVSPPFEIERPFINFLIGGGAHHGETCINLKIGDQVVRTATGPNDAPGGSERLDWHGWDVRELRGQTAVIEILDKATGGWGHINIDEIQQSEKLLLLGPQDRTFQVAHRYLLLPVSTGHVKHRVQVLHRDQVVRDFEIELAEFDPQFQAACDLAPFEGKEVVVRVHKLLEESKVFDRMQFSDSPSEADKDVEKHRPEIHFTAPQGWLNDPNGLVYVDGVWHLFYQHNPYGWGWGNMHWGHATSRDLLHWAHEPIALTPREFGDWAFSGSAVVDNDNTSGWRTGDAPLLVGAYTSTGRGECIVYSNDHGQTWTEFEGNPVVKHQGRDPRLLWHAPTKRWIMAVYTEAEGKQWIAFYNSPDLKAWESTSRIEGFFECPDLFELPLEGSQGESKWVLYAANGEYMLGKFDGREFHPDGGKHRLWHGNFYAAQTFSNAPDGRRIQIGWGQGIEFPGQPFNQQMTIPVELTLQPTAEGPRMAAQPVRELRAGMTMNADHRGIRAEGVVEIPSEATVPAEFELTIPAKAQGHLNVEFWGTSIGFDLDQGLIRVASVQAARFRKAENALVFRVLVDRGSLELFTEDGLMAISAKAQPDSRQPALRITRHGEPVLMDINERWGFQPAAD